MLDHTMRYFKREMNSAMENVLDFRKICKKYLLCKARNGEDDSDDDMLNNGKGRKNR